MLQYECLSIICAKCGCYGHHTRDYSIQKSTPVEIVGESLPSDNASPSIEVVVLVEQAA